MGFYVETPSSKGKAKWLAENIEGARIVEFTEARHISSQLKSGGEEAIIVVVDNGPFEAAGLAFSLNEFEGFTNYRDARPKKFVVMPRSTAEEITGFSRVKLEGTEK